MANTRFQHKRSTVSGVTPLTSDIAAGELGLNLADRRVFTSNGSAVFELGSNLSSLAVGNSTVRQIANTTGVFVNGGITLTRNDTTLGFTATSGASVGMRQQSDDNFVFYTTNTTGGSRAVFNVFANTNAPNQNSAFRFNGPVDMGTSGFYANNSLGSSGQVLTSTGTSVYWSTVASSGGTVTNVATGSGLTGGPITTTGTVSVLPNNGITANSTGLFVTQGTGTVVNSTGVHVNSTFIGTLTANNATNLNGQAASFYTNATNLATGTVPTARLGSGTANSTTFLGGDQSYKTVVTSVASGSGLTGGTVTTTGTISVLANNGITANSTGLFVTQGTGTVVNATGVHVNSSYIATIDANNATNLNGQAASFYTNATNLATGTVPTARLGSGTASATTFLAGDQSYKTAVTSVATGNGLTGGTVTTTGTVSVLANNGITANTTGLFVTQGTGAIVNSTGVHVNSTFIGTLTANNSTNLNGQAASFYTNASNITTGTLPMAQLGSNVVNTTAAFTISGIYTHTANVVMGNTTVNTQYSNAVILISNATSTTTLGLTDLRIGNTSSNIVISNTTSSFAGNVAITGSANAANVTAAIFTGNLTGTAANSTNLNSQPGSFYTNATNLATGTVPTARLGSGTANASTFLRGDQTWAAAGGSLAGGELFNINVSAAVGYAVNTTMSAAFSAPSTAGLEYVVHSIQVTNIGTANATVSGEFSGTTYSSISFALTVPVPRESAVELLKMPKVMQPSDILRLQADQNSTLHAYITYETISSTAFFGSGVDITTDATFTDLHTATGNSVITSLLLANDDGVNDVKARVVWTDGSNVIQGYLCFDLIVPADATVELLEKVKYLPSGHKIRVLANIGNRLEAIIAGKLL